MFAQSDRGILPLLLAILVTLSLGGLYALLGYRGPGDSALASRRDSIGRDESSSSTKTLTATRLVSNAASNENTQRLAKETPGAWIHVLEREDLSSLQPAEISLRAHGSERLERIACAPDRHRVVLREDQIVSGEIRVGVAGYVPLAGELQLQAGENRILLSRGGDLQIELRDAVGSPVEGVEIALLPPLENGADWRGGSATFDARRVVIEVPARPRALLRMENGWAQDDEEILLSNGAFVSGHCDHLLQTTTRRTDDLGRVAWSDLPALPGYRWGIRPPTIVEVSPAHEQVRLAEVDGKLRTGPPPPSGISGRFEIIAGESRELGATILEPAGVHGRIFCPTAVAPAIVTLYRVGIGGGLTAKRGVAFDSLEILRCEANGEFRFADLRPDTYAVRAWWEGPDHNLFFTCQTFCLQGGAQLDLGTLEELAGESLQVSLGIVDQDGNSLEPHRVYTDPAPSLFALLAFTATPTSGDARHMVSCFLPLPFGESFHIHGLQPGRAYASIQPGEGFELNTTCISRIESAQPAGFEIGSRDTLALDLVAHVGVRRAVVLRDESGQPLDVPLLWAHDVETGRVATVDLIPTDGGSEGASRQLTLPPGTYDLWSKITTSKAPQGLTGSANVRFDPADRDPIEIVMRPAASVSGTLRDESGRPLPHHTLRWTLGTWPLDDRSEPLYCVITDGEGDFTLREVPADVALRSERPGTDLLARQAGAYEGIELVHAP